MAVKTPLNKNTMCTVWTTSVSSLSVESFRKINGTVWVHKSFYSQSLGCNSLLHFRELTCLDSKERKFRVCAVWVSEQLSRTFPCCHKYCWVWILHARNALVPISCSFSTTRVFHCFYSGHCPVVTKVKSPLAQFCIFAFSHPLESSLVVSISTESLKKLVIYLENCEEIFECYICTV